MNSVCTAKTADKNLINELVTKCNISEFTANLLYFRGIQSVDEAKVFFSPTFSDLTPPIKLDGVSDAAARIDDAIENAEKILIYGDYDADGICASLILKTFFDELCCDVEIFIPEREDGYGITEDMAAYIIKRYSPNLVITADCGITAAKEVEYFASAGVDVIVTDHHESDGNLPSCIVINPKICPTYPCSQLCGAGVALKLVSYLTDGEISNYLDFAAIATLADSVPLSGENRTIVKLGLKEMEDNPKPYLQAYTSLTNRKQIKSDEVSYYLAPCINAAGRMGQVGKAVEFLLSEDYNDAIKRCNELLDLNAQRKQLCDSWYEKLTQQIETTSLAAIVVSSEIPKGILGIVSGRIAENYRRPTFVFSDDGNTLSGSSRSIEGINIYELISNCSHLLLRFGGHKMAAGLGLNKCNFLAFKQLICEQLMMIDKSVYSSSVAYDSDFVAIPPSELDMLEPFGVGFPRPKVKITASNLKYTGFGKSPNYMKITAGDLTLTSFSGEKYLEIMSSGANLDIFGELAVSSFGGSANLDIRLLSMQLQQKNSKIYEDLLAAKYLEMLFLPEKGQIALLEEKQFFDKLNDCLSFPFGTAVVALTNEDTEFLLNKFPKGYDNLQTELNFEQNICKKNMFVIGMGGANCKFDNVFFLSQPPNGISQRISGNVFSLSRMPKINFGNLSGDRQIFAQCFRLIKSTTAEKSASLYRWYKITKAEDHQISLSQFIACMLTFFELKILKMDRSQGTLELIGGQSGNLADSKFYNKFTEMVKV